jgi:lipid-A-disaccharide synthase
VPLRVLVSAGEASSDLYAAALVSALRDRHPDSYFFGCAGPRMRNQGVHPVIDAESLSVVGLVEVIHHLPRIYRQFRRMVEVAKVEKPDFAILTDSPDFHLRLARKLARQGVPVIYLVAPQVWAWREGRLRTMRETIRRLLCIFPFEEPYFRQSGIAADYIGHPLARLVRPSMAKPEFFTKHGIPPDRPLIALLPGSRPGEVARHLGPLADAAVLLGRRRACTFVAATPPGFSRNVKDSCFWERFLRASIQIVEGSTWDLLAHADVALAASGTVTIEAALLGTPMVTFYRVAPASWALGRWMVRVPYLSMVNLVAGRAVIPELMQADMTGARLAAETERLLESAEARAAVRAGLMEVRAALMSEQDPMEKAANIIDSMFEEEMVHVS